MFDKIFCIGKDGKFDVNQFVVRAGILAIGALLALSPLSTPLVSWTQKVLRVER
jgi:hypothetical protein